MITTTELSKRTKLSAKTLSRWVDRKLIPAPKLALHPSGRGQIGYWPDSTVDLCLRIDELRREGMELDRAAQRGRREQHKLLVQGIMGQAAKILTGEFQLATADGEIVDTVGMLRDLVVEELGDSMLAEEAKQALSEQLANPSLLREAIRLIAEQFNPYITFDGERAFVFNDFLLYEASMARRSGPGAFFAMPIRPLFLKLRDMLDPEYIVAPVSVSPARKVWVREKGEVVEYGYHLGGPSGFELVRDKPAQIGASRKTPNPVRPKKKRGKR